MTQWLPLLRKYFREEDLDKAMYVLQWESSGNPNARSDSGGYGLFQLNDGGLGEGLTEAQRLDPETNVRTAAAAVYGGSGWKPWGEGSEVYNYPYDPNTGKGRFGSLGDRPYGGTSSSVSNYQMGPDMAWQDLELPFDYATYLTKASRYAVLDAEIQTAISNAQAPDPAKVAEWGTLQAELNTYDEKASQGGQSFDDYIRRMEYENANNPALIDAQNAANKFARQLSVNTQAQNKTTTDMAAQRTNQESAETSQQNWRASSAFSSPLGFRVGSTDLPTEDEVFAKNISQVEKDMPANVDIPYSKSLGAFGQAPTLKPGSGTNPWNLPKNFGQEGYDVEGDTLQPANRYPSGVEGPMSSWMNGGGTPGQPAGIEGPQQASSAFSNPLLTRMQSFNPPTAGPPTPAAAAVKNNVAGTVRRFTGSILGRRF